MGSYLTERLRVLKSRQPVIADQPFSVVAAGCNTHAASGMEDPRPNGSDELTPEVSRRRREDPRHQKLKRYRTDMERWSPPVERAIREVKG